MKTNIDIRKDVTAQLRWEPMLNAAEIGVAVKITNKPEIESITIK